MEMNDLYLNQGEARAHTRLLSVEENPEKWFEFGQEQDIALGSLDTILMRKDPHSIPNLSMLPIFLNVLKIWGL